MEFIENNLTYEDYIALRASVDWNIFDEGQTRTCVSNSTYTITAVDDGKVIGMARMIGDGMYFLIADVVVRPEYQGKGIGSQIMDKMIEHVEKLTPEGGRSSVTLLSVSGKEEFYMKKGFKLLPHEFCGPGMRKVIKK